MTAICKKGKKSTPGNYRPFSLTSIVCKVMKSLVRDQVVDRMATNQLVTDNQHGFLNGRSCTTNLLAGFDAWSQAVEVGVAMDAVYLDFAKAFDMVPHHRLLMKLDGYGIRDRVSEWIKQFLQGRRQCVNVNGSKSSLTPVTSGIPQGSVLEPSLFAIFISDLLEVNVSLAHIFVDDTKVFTRIKGPDDQQQLQDDIDSLILWSRA